jgi:nitrite reductase/ring-hydroxylating ferredoxin subunit
VGDFVRAMAAADLAPGQCAEVTVAGTPVAIYNVDGTFYATSNICLHRGGPLGQGLLEGEAVMCPWHAWSWNVKTGENVANGDLRIPTYEVKVESGQVLVKLA